jgi:hypothetical protein
MLLPVNFKIFFTRLPGSSRNQLNERRLRFTNPEGNKNIKVFTMVVFNCDHELIFRVSYTGADSMEVFISCLMEEAAKCKRITRNDDVGWKLSREDKDRFSLVISCELCENKFNTTDKRPHMHHHHLSNRKDYFKIQKLCARCNMKIVKNAVVAISHEFSERDGKLILSSLKPTATVSSFSRQLQLLPSLLTRSLLGHFLKIVDLYAVGNCLVFLSQTW